MSIARIMNHAVWWSMAMFPTVVAISRDPFKASNQQHGTFPSEKCQLTPYRTDQSTIDIDFDFLLATSPDDAENMEQFLIREIGDYIFDCLSIEGSHGENVLNFDRLKQEHPSNNYLKGEWSRKAREIGIVSLTVVRVSPGM